VVAVSTESRDLLGDEARARLAASAPQLARCSPKIFFKKIDSTLRGNVGKEIAAALDIFGFDIALVCPAFPALNRVMEQGRLRVEGRADFDPVDIAALLRGQGLDRHAHIEAGGIGRAVSSGARVVSLDALCDRDLDQIAAEALALHRRILWVGSGGLAAALARTLPVQSAVDRPALNNGPVLFCIGSDHAVTTAQVAALNVRRAVLSVAGELAKRENILEALDRRRHVCLSIPRNPICFERVRELIAGLPAAAIFLSGGDTASLVCRAVGVQAIDLYDEIVPGIPCGVLRGGEFDGTTVATKSGAFGDADALIQVADYFLCPTQ
jgi:uncharacterized protein YgbK (DUF1537 family)